LTNFTVNCAGGKLPSTISTWWLELSPYVAVGTYASTTSSRAELVPVISEIVQTFTLSNAFFQPLFGW